LLVRPWCVLVRRGFGVQAVHPGNVRARNQVPVGINGDLNRAVAR